MGFLYGFVSFFIRQPINVAKLVCYRWWYSCQLSFLGSQRAWKLGKISDFVIYCSWLWSAFGWRRYMGVTVGVGGLGILLRIIWVFLMLFLISNFDLSSYSEMIFGFFGDMELSHRGYLGYTVVVCCTLSWILQFVLWSSSSWCRELIKPYRNRLLTVNLVIFLLLMSLGAQVARAKLGVRVWYPNERVYGERIGAAYWE